MLRFVPSERTRTCQNQIPSLFYPSPFSVFVFVIVVVEGPFLDSRLKVSDFNGVLMFEGFDTRFGYELEGVIEYASRSEVRFNFYGSVLVVIAVGSSHSTMR